MRVCDEMLQRIHSTCSLGLFGQSGWRPSFAGRAFDMELYRCIDRRNVEISSLANLFEIEIEVAERLSKFNCRYEFFLRLCKFFVVNKQFSQRHRKAVVKDDVSVESEEP